MLRKAIVTAILTWSSLASADLERASELNTAGRYAEAATAARAEVARSRGEDDSKGLIAALELLADSLVRDGHNDAAAEAADEAVALAKAHPPELASALIISARIATARGRHAAAIKAAQAAQEAQEALRIAPGGHSDSVRASALDTLGIAQRQAGDTAAARASLTQAFDLRKRLMGEQHPDTATSIDHLCLIDLDMRDGRAAQRRCNQALEIRRVHYGANHPLVAESLNNLASAHWLSGNHRDAAKLYEQSLSIKQTTLGESHPSTATAMNNLAEVYRALKQPERAIALLRSASLAWESRLGSGHPKTWVAWNNLAKHYWRSGALAAARPLLQKVADSSSQTFGDEHPTTARAKARLAALLQSSGETKQALALYRDALAVEDRTLATILNISSAEHRLEFLRRTEGHYYAALSLVDRHFRRDANAARFALGLVLRRKGIVLDAESRARDSVAARLKPRERDAWRRLTARRDELAELVLSDSTSASTRDLQSKIAELEQQIATAVKAIGSNSAIVASEQALRQATVERLAKQLPEDSLLLEYVLAPHWDESKAGWSGTSNYLAFVLDRSGDVTLINLGTRKVIDKVIDEATTAIQQSTGDLATYNTTVHAKMARLYDLLLRPAASRIRPETTLIFGPDGKIGVVPFAALRTPSKTYLIEQHPITHVSSGRDLLRLRRGTAHVDLAVVANPAFGAPGTKQPSSNNNARGFLYPDSFQPLAGAAQEGRIVRDLVPGRHQILEGTEATEVAVTSMSSPQILHMATHGFFLSDRDEEAPASTFQSASTRGYRDQVLAPMTRSGLALAGANLANRSTGSSDGILTALEVTAMDLSGTELVVLSACQTALGTIQIGQGVYGLRRAFVLAGAQNLVMSLWPVSDKITRDLMERFYSARRSGQSLPVALREAQVQTLRSLNEALAESAGDDAAPVVLWAPFVLQQAHSSQH